MNVCSAQVSVDADTSALSKPTFSNILPSKQNIIFGKKFQARDR